MDNALQVLDERRVFDKLFTVYGTYDDPLFLAKDVAEWIDYAWKDAKHDHRDVSKMLKNVDSDEKILYKGNNLPLTLQGGSGRPCYWFLTEDGFYEVCMTSRKPIAKKWKKQVKKILHEIRVHGMYVNEVKSPIAALEMLGESIKAIECMFVDMDTRLREVENHRNNEITVVPRETIKQIELPNVKVMVEEKPKSMQGVNASKMAEMLRIGKGKSGAREFNNCMLRAGVIEKVDNDGYRFTELKFNRFLGIERQFRGSHFIYWFPENVMDLFEYRNNTLVCKA